MNAIHRMSPNRPGDRFYLGGSQIDRFRSLRSGDPHTPEDWVASTTTLFAEDSLGLSALPDGRLLAEAIANDPNGWLGPAHLEAYGADPMLLVKLLDAGERLPVHVHPSRSFAMKHLSRVHGKTEAWVMLASADVFVGWSRDVSEDELHHWVNTQEADKMLRSMNRVHAAAGDVVLVPSGTAHAIDRGAFLVELQEPEDLSILLEWDTFDIDGATDGHLGLGFDRALQAVNRSRLGRSDLDALVRTNAVGSLMPQPAAPFFRADRFINGLGAWPSQPSFTVVVVLDGAGAIAGADGSRRSAHAGETFVVQYSAGLLSFDGALDVVCCRPPAPGDRS